jgi:hypothetical protein
VISGQRPVIRNAKTMATIDIHDLSGKKVGTFDLADEIFGAVNEDLIPRRAAPRHACDQGPLASFRFGQEAVEAEGHGASAYRLDPVATVEARRHGAWSDPAVV